MSYCKELLSGFHIIIWAVHTMVHIMSTTLYWKKKKKKKRTSSSNFTNTNKLKWKIKSRLHVKKEKENHFGKFTHINTKKVSHAIVIRVFIFLREALPPLHVYSHDKSRHTASVQCCGWIWPHTDISLQHWRASLDKRESDWRWLEQSSWRTSWN